MPSYLSPTQLSLWEKNPEEYYLKYLATDRPPRIIQTQPMSVGSAFDARVKSYLYKTLIPNGPLSNELSFDTLFEKQVEVHNRDWARRAGDHCFHVYEKSGALSTLQRLLSASKSTPQFETTERTNAVKIKDGVMVKANEAATPLELMGKPDVYFSIIDILVTLDFKVNGYCSNAGKSPTKGYVDVFDYEGNRKGHHQEAYPCREELLGGLLVNSIPSLEQNEKDWARQLSTYSWLVGAEVGQEIIVMVDQLCCNMNKPINGHPNIRVARHICRITKEFQVKTFNSYQELWNRKNSNHFFRDRSIEDSLARCEALNQQAAAFRGDTDQDQWLREISGRG